MWIGRREKKLKALADEVRRLLLGAVAEKLILSSTSRSLSGIADSVSLSTGGTVHGLLVGSHSLTSRR